MLGSRSAQPLSRLRMVFMYNSDSLEADVKVKPGVSVLGVKLKMVGDWV